MFGFVIDRTVSSASLGLRFTAPLEIPAAAREIEDITVRGREGTLTRFNGWKDTVMVLNLAVSTLDGFTAYRKAVGALTKASRISFTAEPGMFHLVKHVEVSGLEQRMSEWGFFTATLTCQPFTYFIEGEKYEYLKASGSLYNPGLVDARPIINLYGTGTFTLKINSKSVTVVSPGNSVTIDSGRMLVSVANKIQLSALRSDFPVFTPGWNTITVPSGITTLEIAPNWRTF